MTQRTSVRRGARHGTASKIVNTEGGSVRGERLQKVLAAAGFGSRRECESLILEGRVEVDRQVVSQLGTRVDADQQEVRLDGVVLRPVRYVYLALNKPAGVVSTNRDPQGRQRVVDLVPNDIRLFSVGRLDRFSEGLLLLTNDGDLANRLTHPRYGVEKIYRVRVAGNPSAESIAQLRKGVYLAEGFARVASVRIKKRYHKSTELEIVLDEGRNREVRRLLARIGHKVTQLCRVAIGSLRLGEMPVGSYRRLTQREVRQLRKSVGGGATARQPTGKPTGRKSTGRVAGGSKPTGRQPTGRVVGGDETDRVPADGARGRGSKPTGRKPTGRVAGGSKPTGRKPTGRKPTGRKPTSRVAGGSKPTGRKPTGRVAGGSKPTGRKPTGRVAGGSKPTGRKPMGGVARGSKPTGSKPTGGSGSSRTQGTGRARGKNTGKRRS